MFGAPFGRPRGQSNAPSQFKELARNAIYQQLPPLMMSGVTSIRSAPSQVQYNKQHQLHKSLSSSIFSNNKRSVRSAPSIYSSSTATIPEDSEPVSTTVEQLVNDIALHEKFYLEQSSEMGTIANNSEMDVGELYKISLGSELQYQNIPESLVDWNLNVTRCKLIITLLPSVSAIPELSYSSSSLPQLVGDLANICHIVLIQPHITDTELIYTLFSSNLYQEHNLDIHFKRSVAEVSVKQSRLLQINSTRRDSTTPITSGEQSFLKFKFKEIAVRNYLINLATAATTAYEYKQKTDSIKKSLKRADGPRVKLSKDEKKRLWDEVRLEVFRRAGLEEN